MAWICRIFLYIFVLSVPQSVTANRRLHKKPFMPGWYYKFHDEYNTICPMVEESNAKLGLWDFCDADIYHSLWKVVQGSQTGTFTLVNHKTDMCMTVGIDMQDTGINSPVVQYECQNPPSASQLWSYLVVSREEENFTALKNGDLCISNKNPELGTTFYMSDCDGSTGQLMTIQWW